MGDYGRGSVLLKTGGWATATGYTDRRRRPVGWRPRHGGYARYDVNLMVIKWGLCFCHARFCGCCKARGRWPPSVDFRKGLQFEPIFHLSA